VVLANVSLSLHDVHLDLTREKVFTPSARALDVVDRLQRPVKLTYFYQGQDQSARRAKEIVEVMGVPIGTVMSMLSRARNRFRHAALALLADAPVGIG